MEKLKNRLFLTVHFQITDTNLLKEIVFYPASKNLQKVSKRANFLVQFPKIKGFLTESIYIHGSLK